MIPRIMGIVNVTPDSFSDGGQHGSVEAAVAHGLRLRDEGADLVDVGGESTRPGAEPVSVDEELARVLPVVAGLLQADPALVVSVDTRRAEVARAGLEAGARWVNDVSGGDDPDMGAVVAEHGATWVLMHMRGTPATMQSDTHYDDLVQEVVAGLRAKLEAAQAAGVPRTSLWVDPGIGFGKAMLDNPHLVRATPVLVEQLGRPVLIGASRKAFVGRLVGEPEPGARVHGSVGVALAAHLHGAAMLRVHDVRATRHALLAFEACR